MIAGPLPDPTTLLSRGDRLLLIFVATPFMAGGSFAVIAAVCQFAGYDLFGPIGSGLLAWAVVQFLASGFLTLALACCEGRRAGSLRMYTILGSVTGIGVCVLMGDSRQGFWIPPVQYTLLRHLLGRIAYRGVNRPDFQLRQ